MERYNVIGPKEKVHELLDKFYLAPSDTFPTDDPNRSDINIELSDEQADDVLEFCEANNLTCELV